MKELQLFPLLELEKDRKRDKHEVFIVLVSPSIFIIATETPTINATPITRIKIAIGERISTPSQFEQITLTMPS